MTVEGGLLVTVGGCEKVVKVVVVTTAVVAEEVGAMLVAGWSKLKVDVGPTVACSGSLGQNTATTANVVTTANRAQAASLGILTHFKSAD